MKTIKNYRAIIAVAGLLFFASTSASAQYDSYRLKIFNFVVKAGATYPLTGNDDTSNKIGPQLGLEALCNLCKLPMDIGAELYVGSAVRDYAGG